MLVQSSSGSRAWTWETLPTSSITLFIELELTIVPESIFSCSLLIRLAHSAYWTIHARTLNRQLIKTDWAWQETQQPQQATDFLMAFQRCYACVTSFLQPTDSKESPFSFQILREDCTNKCQSKIGLEHVRLKWQLCNFIYTACSQVRSYQWMQCGAYEQIGNGKNKNLQCS